MARPAGWRWSPVPRSLIRADAYLDLATPVSAGSLLDRLYAFACDRYGIFPAGFRALRSATGLEGSAAQFEDALAELESRGFVARWMSAGGTARGIIADYNCDNGGLPASLFHNRPAVPDDSFPPDHVAATCRWVSPADVVTTSEVSHDKPTAISRSAQQVLSRVETETETETESEYDTHAGARALDTTLTRGLAAGKALAATPEPDPLPADLEALAVALLDRIATLRANIGRG